MRRMIQFTCNDDRLIGTIDEGANTTGLIIISGGNEIRSGAYAGQASMAAHFAALGYPVMRYDRRGIGDSEGNNGGFESSSDDIASAANAFRVAAPHVTRVVTFGNCDAASALALFHHGLEFDTLLLANPWVIEAEVESASEDAPTAPTAAAIRARYIARLKNPRSLLDLFTGKINLRKLIGGLAKAAKKEAPTGLSMRIADALGISTIPITLLIAKRDTTALAFLGAWSGSAFDVPRTKTNIAMHQIDSASHSFADDAAKAWLLERIGEVLRR